jgi:hypothetical protein
MTAAVKSQPHTPRPFVETLEIKQEPRAAFGRFFLAATALLDELGLVVERGTPEQLVQINEANRDNWPPLISNFDYREYPMKLDEVSIIVAYDRLGRPQATSGVRFFDLGTQPIGEQMRSLELYYGSRAEAVRKRREVIVDAPHADQISGRILYHGGFWIHPDSRSLGLTGIIPRLNRCLALSQFDYEHECLLASSKLTRPEVAPSYAMDGMEPSFAIKQDGKVLHSGIFSWVSKKTILEVMHDDIKRFNSMTSTGVGRDPQVARAGSGHRQ